MFALVAAVLAFLAALGVIDDAEKFGLFALGLLAVQVAIDGTWNWYRARAHR
jgi:hypothetical protein